MGIPSFYRHLCRRYPHLITRGCGPPPEWLCLDFNCAMYYVLRKMPPLASVSSASIWEGKFCEAIADYMRELAILAKPTKGLYVSCDGVVCAAKRKQQRLRRFKGPWVAAAEAAVKRSASGLVADAEAEADAWNQNALTPGSAFMERLGTVLTVAGAQLAKQNGIAVTVSTTAEPGEGEHKLLRVMREIRPATCTIYGLDADLILLSMLLGVDTGADVRLMREAQEFERTSGVGEWRSLTVNGLVAVTLKNRPDHVRDYVACMSLLGNDFLPRSLTHTVRDEGIPNLIRALERTVWGAGLCIVGADGQLQRNGLLALLRPWAATEDDDMRAAISSAQSTARRHPGAGSGPEEMALRVWNSQPAQWCTIAALLNPDGASVYARAAGDADSYIRGLAWTWDYYSGRPVDLGWFFEEHLPPRWSEVVRALETQKEIAAPPLRWTEALPAWLHLLSVLPADSARALLPAHRLGALKDAPWYWPTTWSLFSMGRSQMWECEPVIPIPAEAVVRGWAKSQVKA